jgi:hypothetical protein
VRAMRHNVLAVLSDERARALLVDLIAPAYDNVGVDGDDDEEVPRAQPNAADEIEDRDESDVSCDVCLVSRSIRVQYVRRRLLRLIAKAASTARVDAPTSPTSRVELLREIANNADDGTPITPQSSAIASASSVAARVEALLAPLNVEQRRAVMRVCDARDYTLILGCVVVSRWA